MPFRQNAPYVSACDCCGLAPNVFHRNAHGRTVHVTARHRSHSEGVHRVPLILHANRPQIGREIGGHLRRGQRHFPFSPYSNAREQEL